MRCYRAILGELVARTAVHVGSGQGEETSDAFFRRDAGGDWVIPGTAVAGSLRALATRLLPRLRLGGSETVCQALVEADRKGPCGCAVCRLFGDLNPGDEDENTDACAALLWVHDARPLAPPGNPAIRDLVGIDRISGAAARSAAAKFDVEVLPTGTVFRLRLELDADAQEPDEQLLAAVLAEWEQGRATIGGRAARGLGAFELRNLQLITRDLSTAPGLLSFLRSDAPWQEEGAKVDGEWCNRRLEEIRGQVVKAPAGIPALARRFATFTFELQAEGAFLIGDAVSAARAGFDHAPLLVQPVAGGKAVLPGSTLRGVLRAQAERIARTLATLEAASLEEFGPRCPACDPLSSPGGEQPQATPLASCDGLLRAARRREKRPDDGEATEAELCLGCRLFGNTRRGSRLLVEDALLAGGEPVRWKPVDFLAIDRFTGGGREGAKFDALALWRSRFTARLHLDNPEEWELGWLTLVLRDLAEGLLGLGFGAAKGFGAATLQGARLRLGFLTEDDFPGPREWLSRTPEAPAFSGVYHVCTTALFGQQGDGWLEPAESWVKQFVDRVSRFQRVAGLELQADSYFDHLTGGLNLEDLYPREVSIHGEGH
jgi:CRISPR/Cas system CSM-associated protein Csm3 (group 7 of RAMP superfamily)